MIFNAIFFCEHCVSFIEKAQHDFRAQLWAIFLYVLCWNRNIFSGYYMYYVMWLYWIPTNCCEIFCFLQFSLNRTYNVFRMIKYNFFVCILLLRCKLLVETFQCWARVFSFWIHTNHFFCYVFGFVLLLLPSVTGIDRQITGSIHEISLHFIHFVHYSEFKRFFCVILVLSFSFSLLLLLALFSCQISHCDFTVFFFCSTVFLYVLLLCNRK